jgi:hypothetical protein
MSDTSIVDDTTSNKATESQDQLNKATDDEPPCLVMYCLTGTTKTEGEQMYANALKCAGGRPGRVFRTINYGEQFWWTISKYGRMGMTYKDEAGDLRVHEQMFSN